MIAVLRLHLSVHDQYLAHKRVWSSCGWFSISSMFASDVYVNLVSKTLKNDKKLICHRPSSSLVFKDLSLFATDYLIVCDMSTETPHRLSLPRCAVLIFTNLQSTYHSKVRLYLRPLCLASYKEGDSCLGKIFLKETKSINMSNFVPKYALITAIFLKSS